MPIKNEGRNTREEGKGQYEKGPGMKQQKGNTKNTGMGQSREQKPQDLSWQKDSKKL